MGGPIGRRRRGSGPSKHAVTMEILIRLLLNSHYTIREKKTIIGREDRSLGQIISGDFGVISGDLWCSHGDFC